MKIKIIVYIVLLGIFSTNKCFALTPVNQLLSYVARDQTVQAENLIKQNPKLLLQKGDVVDFSNRYFKNITAFQYTLWAYNNCMWNMILKYLPIELAAAQLREYETSANPFGTHYTFDAILNAQKDILDNCSDYDFPSPCMDKTFKLAKLQRQVPAHTVHQVNPGIDDNNGYWYYLSYKVGLGYDWMAFFSGGFCAFTSTPIIGVCPTSGATLNYIFDDYKLVNNYFAPQGPIEYKKLKKRLGIA